jgi:endonuclease/exonuclease/phosphatase family metal-dependent hydrolase
MKAAGFFALVCFFGVYCAACGGDDFAAGVPGPPSSRDGGVATATAVPTPSGPVTLRVVSYNVLWGGGLDRRFEQFYVGSQTANYGGRVRLPEIVEVLRGFQPDILAVEEAAGWDEGSPPVIERVAAALGLRHHFLAKNPYGLNVALLSRFEIASAINLAPVMGTNSALAATLALPDGSSLTVIVPHLDPFTSRMRACQVDLLLEVAAQAGEGPAILLGDMNFRTTSAEAQKLAAAGWQAAAVEPTRGIDQVWLAPGTSWSIQPLWSDAELAATLRPRLLSDHLPVGAALTVEAAQTSEKPRLALPQSACVSQ